MLVQHICQVPDTLFTQANTEILNTDWGKIIDPRSNRAVFSTSTAIHLRIHKPPIGTPLPVSIPEWSAIVDTIDNPNTINKYPEIMKLSNWVLQRVHGIHIGRVMIIKVEAGGVIDAHIDPCAYFDIHSRFHIPFKTNTNVVFHNGSGLDTEHMPFKMLCRLNNKSMHAMNNNSTEDRIHLLIDIEVSGGNKIF